jgi:enamine deaminase RidA (YjgF/YER057c/UK114 family)
MLDRLRLAAASLAIASIVAGATSAAAESRGAPPPPPGRLASPSFSQVTVANGGRVVFVSGQVAWDAAGKPQLPGDLEGQTRMVYENLRAALAAAGATFDDVLKYTIFVKDLDETKWRAISKIRAEILPGPPRPASTMVGVTSLVFADLLVEIEAIAVVPVR